eukprot:jgi/Botrbrau1/1488/Bobra.178_3s0043.1
MTVAVVVGIGPGLGASIARRFALAGYTVALVSRKKESLVPVADAIVNEGGKALSVTADTGKINEIRQAFKEIQSSLGDPEVLVYNAGPAGMGWPPPGFLDVDPEIFARSFDSGVTGAMVWSQLVLPGMVKAGKGTILFTGATAALRGGARFAPLACSKFALRALSQSIAREFQPQGVHVAHVIIDGIILSDRTAAWVAGKEDHALHPDAIAESYWFLHTQDRSTWTQELDLRPYVEKF